jgi:replication-associated recombination protein RarA
MLAVLEAAGATYISFNPITANTITKALQDIAAKEGFALDPDTADAISTAAAGDLRNAIQSLQLLLLQQQHQAPLQTGKRGKVSSCCQHWQCRRGLVHAELLISHSHASHTAQLVAQSVLEHCQSSSTTTASYLLCSVVLCCSVHPGDGAG